MSEESDFDKRNALWGEYADAYQDKGDENDPEYWSPERVENRRRWRLGDQVLQKNVADFETRDADNGISGDQSLANHGFLDQKDHGKYITKLFGDQGLFSTQGAAVDPNLTYDWATGRAYWKPGTDNYGQSRAINANERSEYNKAQDLRSKGFTGYGQQNAVTQFQKVRNQWQYDAKTGLWVNPGQAAAGDYGNWDFRDEYGRKVGAPAGFQAAGTDNTNNGQPDWSQYQNQQPQSQPFMSTPGQQEKKQSTKPVGYNPYANYGMFPNPQASQMNYGTGNTVQNRPQGKVAPTAQNGVTPGSAIGLDTRTSNLGKPNAFNQAGMFNNQQAWTDDPLDPSYNQSGIKYNGDNTGNLWGAGYNPGATPLDPNNPVKTSNRAGMFNL